MSRAALTVQTLAPGANTITLTAPNGTGTGNGNTFVNSSGRVFLLCAQSSSGQVITVPRNTNLIDGFGPADPFTTTLTTAAIQVIALPPQWYSSAGVMAVDFSSTTGLTIAAVEMPTAF